MLFYPGFFYDYWGYFVFMLPALVLSILAQIFIKTTFSKYSRQMNRRGITGKGAAEMVLSYSGVNDIQISPTIGNLTDNYNPKNNVISLSQPVYDKTSISAVGVAAHEAGHAVQHAKDYSFIKIRTALVPVVGFSSRASYPMILFGCIFNSNPLLLTGIIFFSLVVLFSLITLPVEINASHRAIGILRSTGVLDEEELVGAKKVLTAAAFTYVASTITALMQLLRLMLIYNNRRD